MDKLLFLKPGEQFSVPSLDTLRNLTVLRSNEAGVLVDGEEKTDKGWRHFRDRFAASMVVKSFGTFAEIIVEANTGIPSIKSSANFPSPIIDDGSSFIKTKRTKAPKVVFPDGEFSIKALCDKTGLPYHTIMNEFNRQRGSFKEIRKVKTSTGKGRATTYFQKIK